MEMKASLRKAVISGRDHRITLKDGRQIEGLITLNGENGFRFFHSRLSRSAPRGWQEGEVLEADAIATLELAPREKTG